MALRGTVYVEWYGMVRDETLYRREVVQLDVDSVEAFKEAAIKAAGPVARVTFGPISEPWRKM